MSEVLLNEGLAVTQWHRDDDETSPRYDELRAAEVSTRIPLVCIVEMNVA